MKRTFKQTVLAGLVSALFVGPVMAEKEGLEIGTSIELEANSAGEATVSEVEFGIVTPIGNKLSVEVMVLYEAGAGTGLDTAAFLYGGEDAKLNYTMGLIFVPFGNFSTNMLSDPLALELGESSEYALQIGYKASNMDIDFYLFQGSVSAGGSNLGYGFNLSKNSDSTQMGIGYISNIGDANGLQELIDISSGGSIAANVAGLNLYYVTENDSSIFIFEYMMALSDFQAGVVDAGAAAPSAMTVEYGRKMEMMGKDSVLAIGYQSSEQALVTGLKSRVLTAVTMDLNEHSSMGFEFAMDTDYASASSNSWALQYVYEF